MPDRYSFSGAPSSKPWFRIGNLDVTTTVFITGLAVLSLFVWAFDKALLARLILDSDAVRHGQVWRLVTWPLANAPDFWTVVSIALFWFLGSQLENLLTRDRYVAFLLILTIVPAIVGAAVGLDIAGINYLELGIFIVFIAEFPFARSFFNIPFWILGVVLVGMQVLQLIGNQMWSALAFLATIIVTALILARGYGLANALPWIPVVPLPLAERSSRRSSTSGSKRGSRSKKSKRRGSGDTSESGSGANVVTGPWTAPPPPPTAASRSTAQAELDHLLDKISAGGLDSLSADEKRRLNELSKRLR